MRTGSGSIARCLPLGMSHWVGLMAQTSMSAPTSGAARLTVHPSVPAPTVAELAAWIKAPASRSRVRTPEQFASVIKVEVDKWGRIVKEAGVAPE